MIQEAYFEQTLDHKRVQNFSNFYFQAFKFFQKIRKFLQNADCGVMLGICLHMFWSKMFQMYLLHLKTFDLDFQNKKTGGDEP